MEKQDIQNIGVTALAASSKTPFWTAFKITVGIGLAHLFMFVLVVGTITSTILFLKR